MVLRKIFAVMAAKPAVPDEQPSPGAGEENSEVYRSQQTGHFTISLQLLAKGVIEDITFGSQIWRAYTRSG
jgi:hypothetical protein